MEEEHHLRRLLDSAVRTTTSSLALFSGRSYVGRVGWSVPDPDLWGPLPE
uniref:Uncharacterized protein n=1 Tax=Timema poppense TaxID=170557 RepID=A0A7R9DVY6_TIMPO|nr:unnamed protein product [Timema poppensis]